MNVNQSGIEPGSHSSKLTNEQKEKKRQPLCIEPESQAPNEQKEKKKKIGHGVSNQRKKILITHEYIWEDCY